MYLLNFFSDNNNNKKKIVNIVIYKIFITVIIKIFIDPITMTYIGINEMCHYKTVDNEMCHEDRWRGTSIIYFKLIGIV